MNLARKVLLFVVLAVLAHVTTVAALPWLINAYVMHRIAEAAHGYNRPIVAPRADASARTVVRPSPDLLYTACVFDVSERPLHLTAPVPDSYLSIAGFALDTSNFFAENDQTVTPDAQGRKLLDLYLIGDAAQPVPAGARVIVAPDRHGVVLFRTLITSDADLPHLKDLQAQQSCS